MSRIEKTCKCGTTFFPRIADIRRGWGKSCSKSCAAKARDNSAYYAAKKKARKKSKYWRKKKPYGISEMIAEKVYLLDNPIQISNEHDDWKYEGPHHC